MQSRITKITNGKSGEIYASLLEGIEYVRPHDFVASVYRTYSKRNVSNPSINGRIFEYVICETLAQEKIAPFYYQAQFFFVPNADFDLVLYHPVHPVVLTMKTSLRERYKQAALEGLALCQVYRRAKNYLITLSDEATNINNKIERGDVIGLDKCIIASASEYSHFLYGLKEQKFCWAKEISPINGMEFF